MILCDNNIDNREKIKMQLNELLQHKPKFKLITKYSNILNPSWSEIEYAIESCKTFDKNNFCVLSMIEINSFIQCCRQDDLWRLEIHFAGSDKNFVHYGIKDNTNDNGLLDDESLVRKVFQDFFYGCYDFKGIQWIEYRWNK
ncbi:hypothetical protein F966_01529 [Acinetobacter higginsii]|uniref:Uncharacterized protein n=1 Tax=Acinetobacter higginsii TaxID=70347 RepID=N8XTD9_9GAMM|nr:hypothetical protein [Acinetobacter higginsii]ENV10350.1 hypothetical protein F966_01529 [Acinetobacter higginsii]